ncbi:hypothetical protein [Haladaptatus sp. DFWS20]|uniref:hypothetical protein n=1 Tax=Haladaptatus sp. DFWS20 TaxID=3403467 RepID=UPI003EBE9160
MRHITLLALLIVFVYSTIVVFDTAVRGETRWMEYIAPAVGGAIGMSIAYRSKHRLSF